MNAPIPAGDTRHPGLADYGLLFGLSLLWGSSFYAIKVAVEHGMPPMTLASLRVGVGAVVLLSLARLRGQRPPAFQAARPSGSGCAFSFWASSATRCRSF
jgi:drug/metabolite transporter (DMT)-like permease